MINHDNLSEKYLQGQFITNFLQTFGPIITLKNWWQLTNLWHNRRPVLSFLNSHKMPLLMWCKKPFPKYKCFRHPKIKTFIYETKQVKKTHTHTWFEDFNNLEDTVHILASGNKSLENEYLEVIVHVTVRSIHYLEVKKMS